MAFTPVSYNPAAGRAGYYSRVEIVLDTAPAPFDASTERLLRNDGATMERLARLVDNP